MVIFKMLDRTIVAIKLSVFELSTKRKLSESLTEIRVLTSSQMIALS